MMDEEKVYTKKEVLELISEEIERNHVLLTIIKDNIDIYDQFITKKIELIESKFDRGFNLLIFGLLSTFVPQILTALIHIIKNLFF